MSKNVAFVLGNPINPIIVRGGSTNETSRTDSGPIKELKELLRKSRAKIMQLENESLQLRKLQCNKETTEAGTSSSCKKHPRPPVKTSKSSSDDMYDFKLNLTVNKKPQEENNAFIKHVNARRIALKKQVDTFQRQMRADIKKLTAKSNSDSPELLLLQRNFERIGNLIVSLKNELEEDAKFAAQQESHETQVQHKNKQKVMSK